MMAISGRVWTPPLRSNAKFIKSTSLWPPALHGHGHGLGPRSTATVTGFGKRDSGRSLRLLSGRPFGPSGRLPLPLKALGHGHGHGLGPRSTATVTGFGKRDSGRSLRLLSGRPFGPSGRLPLPLKALGHGHGHGLGHGLGPGSRKGRQDAGTTRPRSTATVTAPASDSVFYPNGLQN